MRKVFIGVLLWFVVPFSGASQIDHDAKEAFIERFSRLNDWSEQEVREVIAGATFQQSIIDKMNRPAEGMPWHQYRNIFMKEERFEAGVAFYKQHQETFREVSARTGVSEQVMLGILGVETYFGQRKGSYKVLDALYTLAFGYPKRSRFFARELEEFLILSKEERLNPEAVEGSYAGAIGYSQFMPSSYRAYAKSFEEGGTRDLVDSPEDAIASVANYLKVHRWKNGEKVASNVILSPEAGELKGERPKPAKSVATYEEMGVVPLEDVDPTTKAALMEFETIDGSEFILGFKNFYVITRYNHSPLYARAVWELGEEIWDRLGG